MTPVGGPSPSPPHDTRPPNATAQHQPKLTNSRLAMAFVLVRVPSGGFRITKKRPGGLTQRGPPAPETRSKTSAYQRGLEAFGARRARRRGSHRTSHGRGWG